MKDLKSLIACLKATEYDDLDACHAAAYLEQLERLTSGDVALPEPADYGSYMKAYSEAQMLEYGARCRADERERCAKVCEAQAIGWKNNPGSDPSAGFIAASNCAYAIRKGGAA